MSRLTLELQRLYLAVGPSAVDPGAGPLTDAHGAVRAAVLELARPAGWTPVSRLWQAVQADLGLPAPAIAVSGRDAYQLWFSLAQPLPVAQARAFLELLCQRYLDDVVPGCLTSWPRADAGHTRLVPSLQEGSGLWSAFVAPDLAPMFAEEPWLDLPPNPDGQAQLLAALAPIGTADLQRAMAQLQPVAASVPASDTTAGTDTGQPTAPSVPLPPGSLAAPPGGWTDPRDFLRAVMNDAAAPLALRVQAAAALLGPTGADRGE